MEYIFDNERPIYIQLVEMIRIDIVSGKFKKGQKLPSVRELALTMKVNPNTMQKALPIIIFITASSMRRILSRLQIHLK